MHHYHTHTISCYIRFYHFCLSPSLSLSIAISLIFVYGIFYSITLCYIYVSIYTYISLYLYYIGYIGQNISIILRFVVIYIYIIEQSSPYSINMPLVFHLNPHEILHCSAIRHFLAAL